MPTEEHRGYTDEQLKVDAEIYGLLRTNGFGGRLWEQYSDELARYGYSIMLAWLRTGLIIAKCRAKNRPVGYLPADWTEEDRLEIVLETVAEALAKFRVSLAAGRWIPAMGATLRTYFAGSCVLVFPTVLRRWQREDDRWARGKALLEQETTMAEDRMRIDPIDVIDARAALESLIQGESERNKAVFHLRFDGYSVAEIAEILGMTAGAVNSVLYRARGKLGPARPQNGGSA